MTALPVLLDHLVFTDDDFTVECVILNGARVWLHLSDARVLVLRLPSGQPRPTLHDCRRLAAALANDRRGMQLQVHLPAPLPLMAELAYRLCPDPRLELPIPAHLAAQVAGFCTTLDGEVVALLGDLPTHGGSTWASVRNYNRLVQLAEPLRQRRLQALQRFGALVAPVLLTAHRAGDRRGARDAWREHDDEVLAAIDQGRDLTGTLAAHYGIGRALVRAPLCHQPLPQTPLALPRLLALIDGIAAPARPSTLAELALCLPYLDALAELAGGNTQALHALGAAVFRAGWVSTWAALLRQQQNAPWLLAQRLHDLRDFLAATQRALQDGGQIEPLGRPDLPEPQADDVNASIATRLALLWLKARGLASLLRASQRWHDWTQQAHPLPVTPGLDWPALLGQWTQGNASALECLSAAELTREGQSMGHCVGSYDVPCAQHGHRILHLTLADERATLQLAPRGLDPKQRYWQAELLGPHNAPVSRAMRGWAQRVLRRVNLAAHLAQRQAVLAAAAVARQHATQPRPDQPSVARLDPVSHSAWLALLTHGLPMQTPRWHVGAVLLDCELAGVDHHQGAACRAELAVGQLLTLVREPTNRHDALAVRVDSVHGVLGYVPRPRNQRIAQALDDGLALQVRLTGLSDLYEWRLRLWVRIKCRHPQPADTWPANR